MCWLSHMFCLRVDLHHWLRLVGVQSCWLHCVDLSSDCAFGLHSVFVWLNKLLVCRLSHEICLRVHLHSWFIAFETAVWCVECCRAVLQFHTAVFCCAGHFAFIYVASVWSIISAVHWRHSQRLNGHRPDDRYQSRRPWFPGSPVNPCSGGRRISVSLKLCIGIEGGFNCMSMQWRWTCAELVQNLVSLI